MKNGGDWPCNAEVSALTAICIKAVNKHMTVLEKQVWDLPASLIKDILPHLNIFHLERIEPTAKCKGVSTGVVWAAIWKDLKEFWRSTSWAEVSADEWRQKCLERLFHLTLFEDIRLDRYYLSNLSRASIISLTAKHVQVLSLTWSARKICKLASDELQPVLATLESNVRCLKLHNTSALFKQSQAIWLSVFHRLIDHGSVREMVLTGTPDARLLTWILQKDSRSPAEDSSVPQTNAQHLTVFGLGERRKPCSHRASSSSLGTHTAPEPELSGATSIGRSPRAVDDDAFLTPSKRPRLDREETAGGAEMSAECHPSQSFSRQPVDSESLNTPFVPACSLNGETCPKGRIHSLHLEAFKDSISRTLSPLLPSSVWLRSLHFHSLCVIEDADVVGILEALRLLFENPACDLTDLSIGSVPSCLPVCTLLLHILAACPTLKSLSLEATAVFHQAKCHVTPAPLPARDTGYSLESLSLRFPRVSRHLKNLTLALRHTSSLRALQMIGLHNRDHELGILLQSLPELNPNLKALSLEDVNLAFCHSEVLGLLNNSELEDLSFKDCRLLEKCEAKEDFLVPFVTALKGHSSLRSLTLSRNRLANGVIALGDLFSGDSPSKIQRLDISSSYILPAGLLEFARRLEANPPAPGLTIDLRCNPLDRDPEVTEQAVLKLRPLCHLFTDSWNSRTTMADHISVM